MASRINVNAATDTQPGLPAGIDEIARDLSAFAPQVLELQRAFTAGYATAQEREHQRLANKHGKDAPRTLAAADRIELLKTESGQFEEGLAKVTRFIEPLIAQGIFSGYVSDAKGDPAAAHVVTVSAREGRKFSRSAKTDAT